MSSLLEAIPVRTVDGQPASLADYAGKVRLVVNVASKCGLTPQYEGLEALYRKYHQRGFEVLAFPANEFGGQEPGSEAEIKEFCSTRYDVTFPLFAKIIVKGPGQHPLYAALTRARSAGAASRGQPSKPGTNEDLSQEISWNFEKFLLSRKGEVVARFAPDVTPSDPQLVAAVERELAL